MNENNNASATGPDRVHMFPIRTVCSVTGVHPVTLRAWERRYGLIRPHRTAKGHRLYTQSDIDRINATVRLLERGIPIGQVKPVLDESDDSDTTRESARRDHWSDYQERLLNATTTFDENRLEHIYNEALSLYPIDMVTRHVLLPLLRTLGTRWASSAGSVAEEHFFGVFLRNKLGARFHHLRSAEHGPKLLLACLPNEWHEVGLLLFALSAKSSGFQVVLLGANLPLEEIPAAAAQSQSQAVVLSGSGAFSFAGNAERLHNIVAETQVPVFIGGECSVNERDIIAKAGAVPLGREIPKALEQIRSRLARS